LSSEFAPASIFGYLHRLHMSHQINVCRFFELVSVKVLKLFT